MIRAQLTLSFGFFVFIFTHAMAVVAKETKFRALVSFGDSLSDVGTYNVSAISTAGGGKYTVNYPGSRIWVERLAQEICLDDPCAATTGLDGSAFGTVSLAQHAGCFAYAQGGSRISNAIGMSNAASMFPGSELGGLTNPVLSQIQQHLSLVGFFSQHDLVTLWAGHNDIFFALASETPVEEVIKAAKDLVVYIKNLIIAQGAKHVLVLNMADIRYTPFGLSLPPDFSDLINNLVMAFNKELSFGFDNMKEVLLLDIYTQGHLWIENPAAFGITNYTTPACNFEATLFPSTLLCTLSTLISDNTAGYFYADMVHPAAKGQEVIADYVIGALKQHGWLSKESCYRP